MSVPELLQIVAACQATFILGISVVILYHYLSIGSESRNLRLHIITIVVSYNLLTICTLISTFNNVYDLKDWWQYFALAGYTLGDLALVTMLRRVVRNHNRERIRSIIDKNS